MTPSTPRRHRVLICSNVYPPDFVGGAELIAHQYAKCLARLGHEVLVFAGDTRSRCARHHTTWRDVYEGVRVVRVRLNHQDFSPDFSNFSHPDLDRDFTALVDEFRPTVVHCHNLTGLSAGVLHSARALQLSTIVTLHDHWGFCYRNTLMKNPGEICLDYRRCAECRPSISDGADRGIPIRLRNDFLAMELDLADLLISPSRYLADRYVQAGFAVEQIEVIPYGIDVVRFAALQGRSVPTRLRFAFVGHFGAHKGLHVLAEALTHLREMRDRFELFLVGEGELLSVMRQHVIDHGWEKTVVFPGKVDNAEIETVYRRTDVLLLPSIWPENQPVSITEAMAAGIPVVASRIGGIPELVDNGHTGFLVQAGDPEELATKMEAFIRNPDLVRELGAKAAERIAGNTFERRVTEYVSRYDAVRPGVRPARVDPLIVVCLGRHFSRACSAAIEALSLGGMRPRFVMREWIDGEQLARAALIWVVDEEVEVQEVIAASARGAALLVPAACPELRRVCVEGNCGLYYGDEYEAAACLELLLGHRRTREALGGNAVRQAARTQPARGTMGSRLQ
jgi:glycosyltransferase involved in cell wall biosynthesis